MELSVMGLADKVTTEADAYVLMEQLRWTGRPVCPHCGNAERCYFLNPENGSSRRTRTGSSSERRVWKCAACRKQFSVLTGTIFHGTKIPLRKWLFVIFEMCASKNGVSAREVERKYELSAKSAWFMTHRIREAMKREPLAGMLRGAITADESWIGGDPRNQHEHTRKQRQEPRQIKPHRNTNLHTDKIAVLSLVNHETGEVRSRVVPDVTGPTLRKAIAEQVDMASSTLYTDSAKPYVLIGREFAAHRAVDHKSGEYVARDGACTNMAENFFSQLKRSIDGTHHHVSREHLHRYLAEFDYRYSTRKLNDSTRMVRLIEQVEGKRLSYRPLTGRG
jgi:transposase-like protein